MPRRNRRKGKKSAKSKKNCRKQNNVVDSSKVLTSAPQIDKSSKSSNFTGFESEEQMNVITKTMESLSSVKEERQVNQTNGDLSITKREKKLNKKEAEVVVLNKRDPAQTTEQPFAGFGFLLESEDETEQSEENEIDGIGKKECAAAVQNDFDDFGDTHLKESNSKNGLLMEARDTDFSDDWEDNNGDQDQNAIQNEWDVRETEVDYFGWSDDDSNELDDSHKVDPQPIQNSIEQWSDDESSGEVAVFACQLQKEAPKKTVAEEVQKKSKKKKKKTKRWSCENCFQINQRLYRECTRCRRKRPRKAADLTDLRAPIGVIMGNVDSGKTSLLDYIRRTKVQVGEAGGITQQIGTTNLPIDEIKNFCGEDLVCELIDDSEVALPGLLIIDTPGHMAFGNMRERGSTMCDIAIVVINIFDGINGTAENCIQLLKENKVPFIVALNQIDKLYGWEVKHDMSIAASLESQKQSVQNEFERHLRNIRNDFANLELNVDLFWENSDLLKGKVKRQNLNLVPTSAKTGCGVRDLLLLWVKLCQTRKLSKRLKLTSKLNCTILEVKKVIGLGYVLDVLITDGYLCKGQTIAVCSMAHDQGIVTKIRNLQTPCKIQDSRVERAQYNSHHSCSASMGCRIICKENVQHAVAGSKIILINNPSDKMEVMNAQEKVQSGYKALQNMNKSNSGVLVVASTLGSLEALTNFLNEIDIPMCCFSLGTVHKKHVMRVLHMKEEYPEYACILAFDVQISKEATDYAEREDIPIFCEEIIYQLQDQFRNHLEYIQGIKEEKARRDVVFPCVLKILEDKIFNRKNPIVMGVQVELGELRLGTPLVALTKSGKQILIGRVESIREGEHELDYAGARFQVAIKVVLMDNMSTTIEYNRHFDHHCQLVSKISRRSLDVMKKYYFRDITRAQVLLLKQLKENVFFKDFM